MPHILIAEDDPLQRLMLKRILESRLGYSCVEAANGAEALYQLKQDKEGAICAVLLDLQMPEMDGKTALTKLHELRPTLPILILTASNDVNDVVDVMRAGAIDFLNKPVEPERLRISLGNALRLQELDKEVNRLQREKENKNSLDEIIGAQGGLSVPIKLAHRACTSDINILLAGESGVGKEVIARAIHHESPRASQPFIAINCGAIPKELVESVLFGHKKGSFTGAIADSAGKFREAEGGTLLLDEVGELPLGAQVKLLRALQQREVEPVGEAKPVSVNVRIIAATHRNLRTEVSKGHFREDLYYRLNVFPIMIPALRERKKDIEPLANHFLALYNAREHKNIRTIAPSALAWMQSHSWPGNVRELENAIYRAVLLCDGDQLTREDIEQLLEDRTDEMPASDHKPQSEQIMLRGADGQFKSMESIKDEVLVAALSAHNGSRLAAAEALGVGKSTLYRRL